MAAIKKYAAVASIALSLVLLGYFLYPALSTFSGLLSDLSFYPGAPQPYTFIINRNSTHIFAWNGTTGQNVVADDNASYVRQYCVDAINTSGVDGSIWYGVGEYDFADIPLKLYDFGGTTGCASVVIVGESEGHQGVVWKGNGTSMIEGCNVTTGAGFTDWAGVNCARHRLANIKFEHTTPNNNAVTLNFTYFAPEIDDLWVQNKNATRQGTAIKYGGGQGITGSNLITNEDVIMAGYGTGLHMACDHIVWINPTIYGCDEYQLYWKDSAWGSFLNLQIIHPDGTCNQSYPLYIDHVGHGNTMFDVNIEGSATTMEVPFITVNNGYKPLQIFGFFTDVALDTDVPFWNRTDTGDGAEYFIYIEAHSGTYLSERGNYATVADNEVIAHGCIDFWYGLVTLKDAADIAANIHVGIEWANATHFRVGVYDDGGAAHSGDDVDIYWYVNANRK